MLKYNHISDYEEFTVWELDFVFWNSFIGRCFYRKNDIFIIGFWSSCLTLCLAFGLCIHGQGFIYLGIKCDFIVLSWGKTFSINSHKSYQTRSKAHTRFGIRSYLIIKSCIIVLLFYLIFRIIFVYNILKIKAQDNTIKSHFIPR